MINLGMFRAIFPKAVDGIFKLACQLSSGVTTFDYTTPGDATVKVSSNNVTGKRELWPATRLSHTVAWISQDGLKGVALTYSEEYQQLPGLATPTPALTIHTDTIETPIFGGKSYLGNMGLFGNYYNSPWVGGIHIQTIATIDYVVIYKYFSITGGIRIEKYKMPYNEGLDQELIAPMVLDKFVDFIKTDYSAPSRTALMQDSNGDYYKKTREHRGQLLVANQAGDKTVLFSYAPSATIAILVLTDTELDFSIAEHSIFTPKIDIPYGYPNVNQYSVSGGGTQTVNYTSDSSGCPDSDPTDSYVDETWSMDGTANKVESGVTPDGSYSESFLGVSYDKFTDDIIILSERTTSGIILEYNMSATRLIDKTTRSATLPEPSYYHFISSVSHTQIFRPMATTGRALLINGIDVTNTAQSRVNDMIENVYVDKYVAGISSLNEDTIFYNNGSATNFSKWYDILDYFIVDLPTRSFITVASIFTDNFTYNYDPAGSTEHHYRSTTEEISIDANGIKAIISSNETVSIDLTGSTTQNAYSP